MVKKSTTRKNNLCRKLPKGKNEEEPSILKKYLSCEKEKNGMC
jgi:hypothetical protein